MSASDSISEALRDPTNAPGISSALPADLVRAIGWLRGHLSEPIQLERLAQISGVRPRTLETHFKMFLGTTPLGWVRQMRLARARHEMLHAGPRDTVTGVALGSGFSQLGRFAADYRKVFGELPSTTMQRARSSLQNGADMDLDEAIRLTFGALPFAFAVAPKQCRIALEELGRPQELAPTYGLPKAIAAWCWGQRAAHRFSATPDLDRERSCQLAIEINRATAHAGDHAGVLGLGSVQANQDHVSLGPVHVAQHTQDFDFHGLGSHSLKHRISDAPHASMDLVDRDDLRGLGRLAGERGARAGLTGSLRNRG